MSDKIFKKNHPRNPTASIRSAAPTGVTFHTEYIYVHEYEILEQFEPEAQQLRESQLFSGRGAAVLQ